MWSASTWCACARAAPSRAAHSLLRRQPPSAPLLRRRRLASARALAATRPGAWLAPALAAGAASSDLQCSICLAFVLPYGMWSTHTLAGCEACCCCCAPASPQSCCTHVPPRLTPPPWLAAAPAGSRALLQTLSARRAAALPGQHGMWAAPAVAAQVHKGRRFGISWAHPPPCHPHLRMVVFMDVNV